MAPMTAKEYKTILRTEWQTITFYRDLLGEFVTTLLLTMSATTLGLTWDKEFTGTSLQSALGMGYTVTCLAWGQGEFGGVHMNPCVSLAMVLLVEMTVTKALVYVGIQIAAASAGTAFVLAILPSNVTEDITPTMLNPSMQVWQAYLVEVWLTGYLILVVLGATDVVRKGHFPIPPVIIGMTVSTCISCGGESTGCSMNPALTMGPAIVLDVWDDHWVYWAGPMTGTLLAVFVYKVLFDMVDRKEARPKIRHQDYDMDKKWTKTKRTEPVQRHAHGD